ncbi:MAG: hypothetical protein WCO09_03325 [bacterium]
MNKHSSHHMYVIFAQNQLIFGLDYINIFPSIDIFLLSPDDGIGRHARPAYRRQAQNLVSAHIHILKHIEMFTVYAISSTKNNYIYV